MSVARQAYYLTKFLRAQATRSQDREMATDTRDQGTTDGGVFEGNALSPFSVSSLLAPSASVARKCFPGLGFKKGTILSSLGNELAFRSKSVVSDSRKAPILSSLGNELSFRYNSVVSV